MTRSKNIALAFYLGAALAGAAVGIFDDRNRRDSILTAPVRPAIDSAHAEARSRFSQLLTPEQKTNLDLMQRDNAPRTEKK